MFVPTCFGPPGPSSGSLCRTLLKLQFCAISKNTSLYVQQCCGEKCFKLETLFTKYIERIYASHWSFTKNHYVMHGQQNIKFTWVIPASCSCATSSKNWKSSTLIYCTSWSTVLLQVVSINQEVDLVCALQIFYRVANKILGKKGSFTDFISL